MLFGCSVHDPRLKGTGQKFKMRIEELFSGDLVQNLPADRSFGVGCSLWETKAQKFLSFLDKFCGALNQENCAMILNRKSGEVFRVYFCR